MELKTKYTTKDKSHLISAIIKKWTLDDLITYLQMCSSYANGETIPDNLAKSAHYIVSDQFYDCASEYEFINKANIEYLISPSSYKK